MPKKNPQHAATTSADTLKLVVIGDAEVGKTSLILSYVYQAFPEDCMPTVFDTYQTDMHFAKQKIRLDIHDTPGQFEMDHIRRKTYPGTHVIVICFAVDSPNSFENVENTWWPEIKSIGLPFILVGTKADMRLSRSLRHPCVTRDQPKELAQKIGAFEYVECSAKEAKFINTVFESSVRAHSSQSKKRSKPLCRIL